MSNQQDYAWRGLGRWLSFGVAAVMVIMSVPHILSNVAAGGWNLFLGLLLFGVIASGNRHAPTLATILAILCAVRAVVALVVGGDLAGALIECLFGGIIAVAAYDLHRQREMAARS